MSESTPPLDRPPAQKIEGWDERYVGEDPRVSEIAEWYSELGFEVRIEDYKPEPCEGCCSVCFDESPHPQKVVFTRKSSEQMDEEDLF